MSSVTAEEASEEMTDEVAATFVKVDEIGRVVANPRPFLFPAGAHLLSEDQRLLEKGK